MLHYFTLQTPQHVLRFLSIIMKTTRPTYGTKFT